ncbi:hypothetical protein GRI89_02575 [Altererythrobacter salegens]|uniref:Uncharacterized protein n=1 Tax=Croceibacterium salegens TaxID=1737568 RepID=A0A6I4SVU5_9SPHN|nr:hypothetical protein [Croceibacterium salegens]MXO58432.1 hypothetical protein [Croceibacterium salegens]
MTGTIAHVGPEIPQRLLRATGRHAGAIAFDPDRATSAADRWMESKFAPWAKSILEGWACEEYIAHSHIVFSRADDSAQRLYYYICELQRRGLLSGPEPVILDIAKVPRESSLAHTAQSLKKLADRLGVGVDDLVAAGAPSPHGVTDLERPVCLLAGTPPPDRRLHDAIETAGYGAAGATLVESWGLLDYAIDPALGDPFETLARQVHVSPHGPRAFIDAGANLISQIEVLGAAAAVLWQIEEDEAQAWHLPAQRAALERAGIPSLVLTRRDWLARDGAAEEIVAFLSGVGA